MSFEIPPSGFALQHLPTKEKQPRQIIRLNLSSHEIRDLVSRLHSDEASRFKTGRTPELILGTKHIALSHVVADKFPQELFSGPADGSKPAFFSGKLSHTLELRRAKEATAGMDEALELLKTNLKQAKDERVPSEPISASNKLFKNQHRPSPLAGGLLTSRPSSPFLNAGFSPRTGPTSAPLLPGQSKEEKIKLAAIKIPAMHLLAIEPQNPKKLAESLRVKRSDLDQVLMKIAQDVEGGLKKLKDRSYRDLDVWNFPYRSQNDRQVAIDHAISAFDRLRIDPNDSIWQMLHAKQDRNQGIKLSRLNFDKPVPAGNVTPKITERSTDSGSTEGKSMKSTNSDAANKNNKTTATKVTNSLPVTKATSAKAIKSSKEADRTASGSKLATKGREPNVKQDVKYKSSEKVENSDEEASAVVSLKSHGPKQVKQTNSNQISTLSSKSSSQKPPVTSSSGSNVVRDRATSTSDSAMVRTRGGKDTASTSKTNNSVVSSLNIDQPRPRNTSRPRHGSSPAKPSPLGSSPPHNARDAETSSNSSKATTLSSAPSSPPLSTASRQSNARPLSTIDKKQPDKSINGTKRKAETHSENPIAKRHQLTNGKNDSERFNRLPAALEDEAGRSSTMKRSSSDSDASSAGERHFGKDELIRQAKKFHRDYTLYKDLHEKLNKTKSHERNDAELDKVWKMHNILRETKERIWKDWSRLESTERA